MQTSGSVVNKIRRKMTVISASFTDTHKAAHPFSQERGENAQEAREGKSAGTWAEEKERSREGREATIFAPLIYGERKEE